MKSKAFNFEFSPNLIVLLGEQLIHAASLTERERICCKSG
jgi:hypothetical protein